MAEVWRGRSVVLGVTGGVAIFKSVALASKLAQRGAAVDVVMTPAATGFVSPLMFAAVTGRKAHVAMGEAERRPDHIALAERPDLVLVAPATANTLAKMAHGIADNLLTSVLLATRKPIAVVPAMNAGMWAAPATQANIGLLRGRGVILIGPESGHLACGDAGVGRMAEPEDIAAALEAAVMRGERA